MWKIENLLNQFILSRKKCNFQFFFTITFYLDCILIMLDEISHKVERYQNIYLYQKILTYLDLIFIEIHIDPEEFFLSIKSVKISTRKGIFVFYFHIFFSFLL